MPTKDDAVKVNDSKEVAEKIKQNYSRTSHVPSSKDKEKMTNEDVRRELGWFLK